MPKSRTPATRNPETSQPKFVAIIDHNQDIEIDKRDLCGPINGVEFQFLELWEISSEEKNEKRKAAFHGADRIYCLLPMHSPLEYDLAISRICAITKEANQGTNDHLPAVVTLGVVPVGSTTAMQMKQSKSAPWPWVFTGLPLQENRFALGTAVEAIRRKWNRSGQNAEWDAIELAIRDGERRVVKYLIDGGCTEVATYPAEIVEFTRIFCDAEQVVASFGKPELDADMLKVLAHYVEENPFAFEKSDALHVWALRNRYHPQPVESPAKKLEIIDRLIMELSRLGDRLTARVEEARSIPKEITKKDPAYEIRSAGDEWNEAAEKTSEFIQWLMLLRSPENIKQSATW